MWDIYQDARLVLDTKGLDKNAYYIPISVGSIGIEIDEKNRKVVDEDYLRMVFERYRIEFSSEEEPKQERNLYLKLNIEAGQSNLTFVIDQMPIQRQDSRNKHYVTLYVEYNTNTPEGAETLDIRSVAPNDFKGLPKSHLAKVTRLPFVKYRKDHDEPNRYVARYMIDFTEAVSNNSEQIDMVKTIFKVISYVSGMAEMKRHIIQRPGLS